MADFYVCKYCHGSGQVTAPGDTFGGGYETVPCSSCHGSGRTEPKSSAKHPNPGEALEAAIRAMQEILKTNEAKEKAKDKDKAKLNEVNFPATPRGFRKD